MEHKNYHDELIKKNIIRLREYCNELPEFCNDYFLGTRQVISSRTHLAYAYDLKVFFEYIHNTKSGYKNIPVTEFPIALLDDITRKDIIQFLEYVSLYEKDGKERMNDEKSRARKLSTLKSFYRYFYTNELIKNNPAALVPMPKIHEKEIIRLDINEVVELLDLVERGDKLTAGEKRYFNMP